MTNDYRKQAREARQQSWRETNCAFKSFSFITYMTVLLVALAQSGCVALTGPTPPKATSGLRKANTNNDTASGTGQLSVNPTSLSFGSVSVGSSSTFAVTLSNSSNSNVIISNVSLAGPGFDASGVPTGLILSPGNNATLNVTFSPASTGSVTGSVTISSDATNSPVAIPLSGSGTQSTAHSVALSWSPSTSTVIGYNVYRSGSSGGPYAKLTPSVNTSTAFTDSSVQAGQTYYYAVTSVGTNNTESSFSNPVSATIPTP